MNTRLAIVLSVSLSILAGCATPRQNPVNLDRNVLAPQAGRIAVAMTALPKRDVLTPGADCLLCLATARVMNSSLIDHVRTLPLEDLPNLKNDVASLLRQQGAQVVVVEEPLDESELAKWDTEGPDLARLDYSPLRQKYGVDRLLVLNIQSLGFVRHYSAYIPTDDPRATLTGTGYLVELKSNHYDWYLPVSVIKGADLKWDEAPSFPGLTNAFYQVLELGKDDFLKPFAVDGQKTFAAISAANPGVR